MLSKQKRPYDAETLEPRTRIRRRFQDILSRNEVSDNHLFNIAQDINHIDPTMFPEARPNKTTRGGLLRTKMFKNRTMWPELYYAQVRCKKLDSDELELCWLAFWLPHELVAALRKQSLDHRLMDAAGMDPLTKAHLEMVEGQTGCKMLVLGLWADGVPCNWDRTESVDVLSLSLPGLTGEFRNLRMPITALSHKHVCDETWQDINAVVKWSFECLATGTMPTQRHDGTPWRSTGEGKSDRKRLKGDVLRACLVEVRADWDWMSKVYGFPPHNLLEGCCWKCTCTPKQVWVAL